MKIAAVSDDGVTISQHFGRAPFYVVLTIEGGRVIAREKRDKLGHAHFAGEPHEGHTHDGTAQRHGFDPAAQGGMRPVVTDMADIGEAVEAYVAGTLTDHLEKLH